MGISIARSIGRFWNVFYQFVGFVYSLTEKLFLGFVRPKYSSGKTSSSPSKLRSSLLLVKWEFRQRSTYSSPKRPREGFCLQLTSSRDSRRAFWRPLFADGRTCLSDFPHWHGIASVHFAIARKNGSIFLRDIQHGILSFFISFFSRKLLTYSDLLIWFTCRTERERYPSHEMSEIAFPPDSGNPFWCEYSFCTFSRRITFLQPFIFIVFLSDLDFL